LEEPGLSQDAGLSIEEVKIIQLESVKKEKSKKTATRHPSDPPSVTIEKGSSGHENQQMLDKVRKIVVSKLLSVNAQTL